MKRLGNGKLAALVLGMTLVVATPVAMGEESPSAAEDRKSAVPTEASRDLAADAHVEAVSKAADAVISATKLDLDIRLVSHTSALVAQERL